ncbi:MarR family winged helix-turn-helix transcriptional regulator [Sporosarcina sp. G11-34]|uniref:MarR family winged helix-turn-helix transcriptional regulator n=1 Tax=Sporosarcina sp. G11-34 TaxID=2849605 RepID=UPI0022A8EC6B|nr:MarR family transcriptional regulator [Sporosarcina sp. G11-34]
MLEDDIRILFAKTSAKTRKDYADSLREIKIYVGQDHLLWQLWRKDGATQTELCELMGCEPPTLTNMVKKLEEYGLVTRRRDTSDARVTRVYLTAEGRALENPIGEIWRNHQDKMLKGISIEDRLILKRLLQKIETNLQG